MLFLTSKNNVKFRFAHSGQVLKKIKMDGFYLKFRLNLYQSKARRSAKEQHFLATCDAFMI